MKSTSTIDLMKTSNGYSIIENESLINKPAPNYLNANSASQSVNVKHSRQKLPLAMPKKYIPQQNFTIYPYINAKEIDNHKYIIIPARTQWFNLNVVHEIEKKALPQWFKIKKGVSAAINVMKFQKHQELYRKYRNHIIQLGKTQYVTPLMARKGLAGDACSIIRIHNFLQKWGLINYVYKKPQDKKSYVNEQKNTSFLEQKPFLNKRKDCFERDKLHISKNLDKDDLQLLKKITKKYRPICNSCQGICGVVWYQYRQKLSLKTFTFDKQTQTRNVQSSQNYEYELRLCFGCYIQKNFPIVLSFDDFTKKNLIQIVGLFDFDKKYKKKHQQFIKISQTVERNKFNLKKSSQILKIDQKQLLDILMQIPIKNMQKISRIQPETQDQLPESNDKQANFVQQNKEASEKSKSEKIVQEQVIEDLKIYHSNLQNLERQQKKYYQQFLQAWLFKIYTKMQKLQEWDKAVQWKFEENKSIQMFNIAQKLKKKSVNWVQRQ